MPELLQPSKTLTKEELDELPGALWNMYQTKPSSDQAAALVGDVRALIEEVLYLRELIDTLRYS
jgi:hypothetical protein